MEKTEIKNTERKKTDDSAAVKRTNYLQEFMYLFEDYLKSTASFSDLTLADKVVNLRKKMEEDYSLDSK